MSKTVVRYSVEQKKEMCRSFIANMKEEKNIGKAMNNLDCSRDSIAMWMYKHFPDDYPNYFSRDLKWLKRSSNKSNKDVEMIVVEPPKAPSLDEQKKQLAITIASQCEMLIKNLKDILNG